MIAAKTEWKKPLVDSTFTLALLTGMSVRTVSAKVVANLGWDKVKATHPVFAGDTLYAESTVLYKRESKSRPTQGIVTVLTRGINQDGIGYGGLRVPYRHCSVVVALPSSPPNTA